MKPYRLLFFLHSGVRAGLEEHVLSLLQELSRERFVLGLACPPALIQAMATELASLPVSLYPVEATGWERISELCRLWRIVRAFRPDLVHCHLFRATLVGAPLARLAGVPIVLETYHGREAWRRGLLKGCFVIDRLVSRCVDQIIAVSEAAGRFLVEGKGIPEHKITVIPNGRDLATFQPGDGQRRQQIRQQLGLPGQATVLGVVGRLEEQKGHSFLLEAFAQIIGEFPGTSLMLVGDGSLRAALEAQVARLHLAAAVVFTGFQRDVPSYIEAMDIVVLPSLHEGLPLQAIEASAMARPVIATAVDGTPEIVCHERTGLLVPPADPASLAKAIRTLLRQPELIHRYGAAARRRVLTRFNLQQQVTATERLYMSLLHARKL